jgi:hypothetical protein
MPLLTLVLGVHRSGTSLLTLGLRALGADLGSAAEERDADNPDGYAEHAAEALGPATQPTRTRNGGSPRFLQGRPNLLARSDQPSSAKLMDAVEEPLPWPRLR